MHPFPFPFRSPLSSAGGPPPLAGNRPALYNGLRSEEAGGISGDSPWTELEARLAGPDGAQALAELIANLEKERQDLEQKVQSMTLDRPGFSLSQAYLDAVEAALGFLTHWSAGK